MIGHFLKGCCLWVSGASHALAVVYLLVAQDFVLGVALMCESVMLMWAALYGFKEPVEASETQEEKP